MPTDRRRRGRFLAIILLATALGCGGPSARELKNRQRFEALLSAISLQDRGELEKGAARLEALRGSGELSAKIFDEIRPIFDKARAGDWAGAEKSAYEFRTRRPYFK